MTHTCKNALAEISVLLDQIEADRTVSRAELRDFLAEVEGSAQTRRFALGRDGDEGDSDG